MAAAHAHETRETEKKTSSNSIVGRVKNIKN